MTDKPKSENELQKENRAKQEELQNLHVSSEVREYSPKSSALQMAILAIFTALGPALSLSFVWLPYFELLTLTIFLGGAILGAFYGLILAVLSTTLFEVLVSIIIGIGLPIYPFKLLVFCIVALLGTFSRLILERKTTFSWRVLLASIGGISTLIYDLLTTIGLVFYLKADFITYFSLIATGLPVTAIRVSVNTVLFAFTPEIYQRGIMPLLPKGKYSRKNQPSTGE